MKNESHQLKLTDIQRNSIFSSFDATKVSETALTGQMRANSASIERQEPLTDNQREEFMELYGPLHNRLSRFIQSMVWNREDSRDLLSETILKTYEKFDTIRNKESLLYFMFTVAANLIKKYRHKSSLKVVMTESHLNQRIDSGNTIYDKIALQELYQLMEQLPAQQKEALVMYEISGVTMEEIAKIQGGTLSGVKSRIARARQKLIEQMENDSNSI
jgi:RNA polymerase sigma-70 factor (ECF subfamily)